MEELKNCKLCGKIFQGNETTSVCPDCVSHDEEEFELIREYLYAHPLASIYEVASNLDITINKIKHYLREGRIEIVEKNNQFLACQTCGKPIHTGWFCEECMRKPSHDPKTGFGAGQASSTVNTYNASNPNNPQKKVTSIKFHTTDKK